jgi:tetratricopeptide (TPR) repeat protein
MPVVSLFVSSTFRDFHAERDLLLGAIRAELDDRVAQFGCRVEVIDLRWGLGLDEIDEALAQERTLSVCLAEIDRSRPLFVGLLGDRYGWVPPTERTNRVAGEAGWAESVADGWSVTALEFEHGAFRHEGEHPVFFVRNLVGAPPAGWVDDDRSAVDGLRARVTGDVRAVVRTYSATADGARVTDLADFEAVVLTTLGPLVEARAQALAAGESDPVSVAERLFLEARTTVVGRADEMELLRSLIGQGRSVCLSGASGVGKSTLWRVALELAATQRSASLVVGVAPGTTSVVDVIGRLAGQLELGPPQVEADELIAWWRSALPGVGEVLLAIDGLDGLDADAADLRWLADLPGSVQLLVSTTDAGHSEFLARHSGVASVPIGELDGVGVSAMLAALAGELRRSLPAAVVSLLAQRSRSPLWVQLAFSDLTGLDENDFAQVKDPADVARLLVAAAGELPDDEAGLVAALCDRVDAANPGAVEPIATLLAHSRSGLSPLDLAELTGFDPVVIARVRRGFAGLVAPRGAGGRLGFTHGLVRQSTLRRYPAETAAVHARLAAHHAPRAGIDHVAGDDALWHTLLAGSRMAHLLDPLLEITRSSQRGFRPTGKIFALATGDDPASVLDCVAGSELGSVSQAFLGWFLERWGPIGVEVVTTGRLAELMLDNATRLAGADPNSLEALRDLWCASHTVAEGAMRSGDLDGADHAYRQSLDIAARMAALDPDHVQAQYCVSLSSSGTARVALQRLDLDAASSGFQRSFDIAARMAADDPDSVHTQRALSVSLNHMAEVALRRGDLSAAAAGYNQSFEIRERLAAIDLTNASAQRDLMVALNHMAEMAVKRNDLAAADVAYRRAWEIATSLVSIDPSNLQAQRDLFIASNSAAQGAEQRGDLESAHRAYRRAFEIAGRLAAIDPNNVEIQYDLSYGGNRVARVAEQQGDLRSARSAYSQACGILNRLALLDPTNAQAQSDLLITLDTLAEVAGKLGDLDEVESIYRVSLNARRRLAAGRSSDAPTQRNLMVAVSKVAWVAKRRGDLDSADRSYREALEICARLAAADPSNEQAQHDLAASLDRVAGVAKQRGDLDDADRDYRKSRDIFARLAVADPSNLEAQHDLARSLGSVASMAEQRGDLDRSAAIWLHAAQVVLRLPLEYEIDPQMRTYFSERLNAVAQALAEANPTLAARCRQAASQLRGTT